MDRSTVVDQYCDFTGSADALTRAAAQLADALDLGLALELTTNEPGDDSEGNERLLRHYVSVAVVDRPLRQGRDALYGYRHLLQYVSARRLLRQGFSLAKIAQYTAVVPTNTLARAMLAEPQRSEAELLVAAYKAADNSGLEKTSQVQFSRSTQQTVKIDPIHGMADLLEEIEQMRSRFSSDMDDLRRIGKALDDLNRVISASAKHGLAAQGEFMRTVDQILRTVENTRHEIVQRVDKFAMDLESQFQEGLRRLSDQHTKHIEALLIEHREETLKHLDRLRKDLTQD